MATTHCCLLGNLEKAFENHVNVFRSQTKAVDKHGEFLVNRITADENHMEPLRSLYKTAGPPRNLNNTIYLFIQPIPLQRSKQKIHAMHSRANTRQFNYNFTVLYTVEMLYTIKRTFSDRFGQRGIFRPQGIRFCATVVQMGI